jgi:pimeloyl-ACP methyl ester carboxylesterase
MKLLEQVINLGDIQIEYLEASPKEMGTTDLPIILCLHGFPDNYHSFDAQLEAFTKAGYRVFVPAIPGYSPTSVTNPLPSLWEMGGQMATFIQSLKLDNIYLVGHDWGAYYAAMLLKRIPERFAKAATFGFNPPDTILRLGPSEVPMLGAYRHWYYVMLNINGYGDRAFEMNDYELVEVLWRRWSPNWKFSPSELKAVKSTFRQPGVASAALNYYRQQAAPPKEGEPSVADIFSEPVKVPYLSIGGLEDAGIELAGFERVNVVHYQKGFNLKMVHTGHFPHRERPGEINTILLDFFDQD